MEYLVIDGYNIINAWKDIFNLESAPLEDSRDKLMNILSNYQGYKKLNIIVVFDAHMVKGSQEKQEFFDNLKIVFTKENETADSYIERLVYKLSGEHRVRVVTSDYLEQTTIFTVGGIRMSPRELREEIGLAGKSMREELSRDIKKSNTIMSRVTPDLLEKLEKIRRGKF